MNQSRAVSLRMIQAATDFLLKAQNRDGGWGAQKGEQSNTEATSFAVLGLRVLPDESLAQSIHQGLNWLTDHQRSDGSWPLNAQVHESSWTTSLAIFSLTLFETHHQTALRGAEWLVKQEGRGLGWLSSLIHRWAPQKQAVHLNPDLKGWPWRAGTFSWVEPTAYALIALKKLKPYLKGTEAEERIRQAELMIYDRMCEGGGWNYGNSAVFGENLWPYPDITALTLIALQDHQTAELNQLSLQALGKMLTQNHSGLALSWSILCLSLYGQETSESKQMLSKSYEKTGFLGEIKPIALALPALGSGAGVFRV